MSALADLLKDSPYKLTQFSKKSIQKIEEKIDWRDIGEKKVPYFSCLQRQKPIRLTPEEVVRQLFLWKMVHEYSYPASRLQVEYEVTFGREKKRADICIMDKDRPNIPYIIIEVKKPKLKDGKEQLKSYCNATGAPIGVWTNGDQISQYHRKDPNYFEDIPSMPNAMQRLSDILSSRWTIVDLVKNDKLLKERKSLKDLILEMEDEVR
jgi:type I restriction enzyme M protein